MKSRQGRILVVDNDKKWCIELVETLERDGFSAQSVENVSQALERLSTAIYHIVILDIRFEDSDQSNTEGIDLLQELARRGLKEATKVIMLSGYGTLENMRLAFKDYDVADFLSKTDSPPEVLLDSVRQVFIQEVKINLALDIQWHLSSIPERVVSNLQVNGKLVGRNWKQMAEELEDLFCRLFHEVETVRLRPLMPGWSGAGVVWVQRLFKGSRGKGQDVIVKFGDLNRIKKEYDNFQRYVKDFIGGGRNTSVLDLRSTPHLGGIIYSFLGVADAQLMAFADFYHSVDISRIIDALDHLLQDTCRNWYLDRQQIGRLDLALDYQKLFDCTPRHFERILAKNFPYTSGKQRFVLPSLKSKREFTNPLLGTAGLSFVRFTHTCTTHGDLNPHNLFVDKANFMWLIDFEATGSGHILRDIAMLDSVIRFQLLTMEEATLEERLEMEEVLCGIEHFSEVGQSASSFITNNQALAKAYATVIHLRALAGNLVAQNPDDDFSEYYIALFYNALNTLQFSTLQTVQHEHALLCASLLADRLNPDREQHRRS